MRTSRLRTLWALLCVAVPCLSTVNAADLAPPPHLVLNLPRGVHALVFSPDGKSLTTLESGGVVRVWDLPSGKTVATFGGLDEEIDILTFSPDGKTLATGARNGTRPPDGRRDRDQIWLRDTATWTRDAAPLRGHTNTIRALAFSPDGKTLVSGGDDASLLVWHPAARKSVAHLPGDAESVNALTFSPDGKLLAVVGGEGVVRLRDGETGGHIFTLPADPERLRSRSIDALAFTADGKTLVAIGKRDTEVERWNVATRKRTTALKVAPGVWAARWGDCMTFSPDGRTMAVGGLNHPVQLWDTVSGTQTVMPGGHFGSVRAVAFSSDGRTLAAAGGLGLSQIVKVWDLDLDK